MIVVSDTTPINYPVLIDHVDVLVSRCAEQLKRTSLSHPRRYRIRFPRERCLRRRSMRACGPIRATRAKCVIDRREAGKYPNDRFLRVPGRR